MKHCWASSAFEKTSSWTTRKFKWVQHLKWNTAERVQHSTRVLVGLAFDTRSSWTTRGLKSYKTADGSKRFPSFDSRAVFLAAFPAARTLGTGGPCEILRHNRWPHPVSFRPTFILTFCCYFLAKFERLVLGCIETNLCNWIRVGKLLTRSTRFANICTAPN